MSTAAVGRPLYQGLGYFQDYAVSNEATILVIAWRQFISALANVASAQPRLEAMSELHSLYHECSVANWDGENAMAISEETYLEAANFLALLPLTIRTPDVVPEPKGGVAFEWEQNGRIFVVSVKGRQTLAYAGIFGPTAKTYGSEDFSDSIPTSVISNLQRLRED